MSVVLETSIGDITVDLYVGEHPKSCLNFLKLCKLKYYNFHLFHTVQQNFIAQCGDPTGTGRGGESVFSKLYGQQAAFFEAELKPRIIHTKKGTLSMVNDGNDRHGSQFFLTLAENNDFLDKQNHTVFGEVAEGFETLEKLNDAITDDNNRPLKDIRIFHTVVLDDPFPDPPGLVELVPDNSPSANTHEQLEPRIGADEDTDDEKDLAPEEVEEKNKSRAAKTNALLLELIGDIPDADVKPPDNVLFVCKLNPVTTDEDLEVIFSRFGAILNCEVIRNKKTNESLQYAFIEFENVEDCEKAYFKMDNVLIDDRRIHVDFSQSVSKYKWHRTNKEETDEQKPQYMIKNFEKKNDGYEYVFEEPESTRHANENKKQKRDRSPEKNKKRKHSPSRENTEKQHSSTREYRKKFHSPEEKPRKQYSKVEENISRHLPSEKDNKQRSPIQDKIKRRRSPSDDSRKRGRSPSDEGRKKRRSPSDEGRKKRRSPSDGGRKRGRSPFDENRKNQPSSFEESRKRGRSPSQENRKRRRSPSDESRKRHRSPSRENRKKQVSREYIRKRSPSEESRKKSPMRHQRPNKHTSRRDSSEREDTRRRSSSRDEINRRNRNQTSDERYDKRDRTHKSRR